jgi:hypothetical protein
VKKGSTYRQGYVGENAYGAAAAKDGSATRNRPMKSLTTKSRGSTNDYANESDVQAERSPMSTKNGSKYKG